MLWGEGWSYNSLAYLLASYLHSYSLKGLFVHNGLLETIHILVLLQFIGKKIIIIIFLILKWLQLLNFVSDRQRFLMMAAWKVSNLMEVCSKNQNLQGVSIKLCASVFLSYIMLISLYVQGSTLCPYSLTFFSTFLGNAPPPLASYEYPILPITKNRQEVLCTIHIPQTSSHT